VEARPRSFGGGSSWSGKSSPSSHGGNREAMEAHPGIVEAHAGSYEDSPGAAKARHMAVKAHTPYSFNIKIIHFRRLQTRFHVYEYNYVLQLPTRD
jgi:hypothetical protein